MTSIGMCSTMGHIAGVITFSVILITIIVVVIFIIIVIIIIIIIITTTIIMVGFIINFAMDVYRQWGCHIGAVVPVEVVTTDDVAKAFLDIDVCIMVGAMPRREGMERKDLLKANAKIFETQGKALDQYAKKTVKVGHAGVVVMFVW